MIGVLVFRVLGVVRRKPWWVYSKATPSIWCRK